MSTRSITRSVIASAIAAVLAVAVATPALARPEPGPAVPPLKPCALERIGTQFVRCDDLTGAGARAPKWVPSQEATAWFRQAAV